MLRVMQHISIYLLLKFHKILLFTIKVIHKKLRGLLITAHRVLISRILYANIVSVVSYNMTLCKAQSIYTLF